MKFTGKETLLDFFYDNESNKADQEYLVQPIGNQTLTFTWGDVADQVRRIANYIKSKNFPPKSNIGIISKNCAEWIIADLAILVAGHVSTPFYATLKAEELTKLLDHSESKMLFVGKLDFWKEQKPGVPDGLECISFPNYNPDKDHTQWLDILRDVAPLKEGHKGRLEDIYTIIYTSGTTGNPKGVMHTFQTLASGIESVYEIGKLDNPTNRYFSYLPLCHVAERNFVESGSIVSAGKVFFANSLETFNHDLQVANPTHFLAVPRIWAKFQEGILAKLKQSKLNFMLAVPFLGNYTKKKIKEGLGLNNALLTLSGAAPMSPDLISWYKKLGIEVLDAYGMTENLGAVSMVPQGTTKKGTVGKPYPSMEIKIAEGTNEIWTRSKWIMTGYFKDPELTNQVLTEDGWLKTGDTGFVDEEGFLIVNGRIKEQFKTSKGEFIVPGKMELSLSASPLVGQVIVTGSALVQPIALIDLSEEAESLGKNEINDKLIKHLGSVNEGLAAYEKISKLIISKEHWTEANNLLTPTMKIKRSVLENKFIDRFVEWEAQEEIVIWE